MPFRIVFNHLSITSSFSFFAREGEGEGGDNHSERHIQAFNVPFRMGIGDRRHMGKGPYGGELAGEVIGNLQGPFTDFKLSGAELARELIENLPGPLTDCRLSGAELAREVIGNLPGPHID